MSIRIEKNVPIPKRAELPDLPLNQMEIGNSFVLDIDDSGRGALRQRIYRYQKSNWPKRFRVSKIDDEAVRVHRIADYTKRDLLRKAL